MLKAFSIQKAFPGFSSVIPNLFSPISLHAETAQVNHHISSPFNHFPSLFPVMPSTASLFGSLLSSKLKSLNCSLIHRISHPNPILQTPWMALFHQVF